MNVQSMAETVIASAAGTVVLGRTGTHAGSVWVVVQGWRYDIEGAAGAPSLTCVHHREPRWSGTVWSQARVREEGMWSDIWRIAPVADAVRGTPARLC